MSYPPIGGAPLRNWQNINAMKKFGPVGVFSVFNRDNPGETVDGVHLWQHYNILAQTSLLVVLERFMRWISRWGLSYYWCYVNDAARRLDEIVIQFQPDLVIFEELWLYHYLSIVARHRCRIIFDEHNVEVAVFKATKCSDRSLMAWARTRLHLPQIKAGEKEFINQADQIWVCSEEDNRLLQNLYGAKGKSYVIPNTIDVSYYDCVRLGECLPATGLEKAQHNFIFPGNFLYPPNEEAARLLLDQIYPRLRRVYPDCRLLLVGSNATPRMQHLAQKDSGIIVTGEVPDIRPYLAAANAMIVPLKEGGGTRFKILEAFAAGCPVVSTTKGAEGLKVKDGEHLLIRDSIESIVDGVVHLWSETGLARKLAQSGYELVHSHYSWQAIEKSVETAIGDLFFNGR
jgi:glycosyltransferase involved in cell wall biosynthesis